MRVYEGAARQNYKEVLRSIGAMLDQRGMREILLTETKDGFIVQGIAAVASESTVWSEGGGAHVEKVTVNIMDDDIGRFMDEALARRGKPPAEVPLPGFYEKALRVIGAYIDGQQARDAFFFEQDHAFVVRLMMHTKAGMHHTLAEFTAEDIDTLVAGAPGLRGQKNPPPPVPVDQPAAEG
jgi:hypothetical protein